MWIGRAIADGSMAIICTTTTRTAVCPCCSSERLWESASWRSVLATTGVATTQAGRGTVDRTIGCTGRRRLAVRGHRSGPIHRRDPIRRLGRDLPRAHGRRWIDHRRVDRRLRVTAAVLRARAMAEVPRGRAISAGLRLRAMEGVRRDRILGRRRIRSRRTRQTLIVAGA